MSQKQLFNAYWNTAKALYSGLYRERFEPGREEKEAEMLQSFAKAYDSAFAYNLATALKNQLDRDKGKIVDCNVYYKDKVPNALLQTMKGIWNLIKKFSIYTAGSDMGSRFSDEFWEMVSEDISNYFKRQTHHQEFAKDLALALLFDLEEKEKCITTAKAV